MWSAEDLGRWARGRFAAQATQVGIGQEQTLLGLL
jgi:hypothetical protein